jgi:hypothetical protein
MKQKLSEVTMTNLNPQGRESVMPRGDSLVDILDRVLDKGVVIAGDVRIHLLDIELLTLKIRLIVASVDKAREIGIDWWSHDPFLSHQASEQQREVRNLEHENRALRERLERLETDMTRIIAQESTAHR